MNTKQAPHTKSKGLGSYRRYQVQQPSVLIPLMLLFVVLAILDVLSFGIAIALIVVLTIVFYIDADTEKKENSACWKTYWKKMTINHDYAC